MRVTAEAGGLLAVGSPLLDKPLFRVRATLSARLEEQPGDDGAVLVRVPLAGPSWLRATVVSCGVRVDTDQVFLVRSRLERRREAQILEFRVEAGSHESVCRFEVDPALEVLDIAPAQALPSLFPEVPSASEMADYLHRVAHEQRRAPQILASLLGYTSPTTAERAQALLDAWSSTEETEPLVTALGRFCEARGRRVNSDSLEAFCRLVDLERGAGQQLSPGVAVAVADLFGLFLDEEAWLADFSAFGSYAEARLLADEPGISALVAHLRDQQRAPLDILEDLGRDAASLRVRSAVRRIRAHLPTGRLRVNEEQLALLPLLQASGRPVHPGTVLALCLFVDLETGSLTVEDQEAPTAGGEVLETSMYAMVAVAGAFGLQLEAFTLEGDSAGGEDELVGRLASQAEGGLLVCFRRHGEAGRHWEWIRDRDSFLRAERHGLDFSGLFLGHLPGGWGEAPLHPLDPERLMGRGEVLSREQLALRQIQGALRRLGAGAPDRVLLGQEPQILDAACEWLLSGGAAGLLDPLVSGDTRRQMVLALHRGDLEVRADRRLVLAAAAGGPPLELLALLLLQELSASPLLKLEGAFKYYDERGLRSVLLDRTTNLLTSDEPSVRALAPRLLAARDLAADRATRLGSEYPLGMARADLDPAVQAVAVEAFTRLALSEVVPLPAALELMPFQGGAVRSTLPEAEVQAVLGELRGWLIQLSKVDPVRPMGLPITDAEGSLDAELARPLAETLAGIHQACRQDGTLGAPRWLALVSFEELAAGARALLDSWRQLARQVGCGLGDLDPQECSLDHRLLVEDQAPRLLQRWGGLPYLCGPGRALSLHRVAPGRLAGPWTTFEKFRGVVVTEEAPLFCELLDRARRADLRRVCVLRFPAFKSQKTDGMPERQGARIESTVEFRDVEVLDPLVPEFAPLLRWFVRRQADLGLENEPVEEFRAVLALAEGQRPQAETASTADEPVAEPAPPRDPEALSRAAAALARQFELEGAQERLLGLLQKVVG